LFDSKQHTTQRLPQVMMDTQSGVPTCFVRLVSELLSDRRALTAVGNKRSRVLVMREGLPQESVLAQIRVVKIVDNPK